MRSHDSVLGKYWLLLSEGSGKGHKQSRYLLGTQHIEVPGHVTISGALDCAKVEAKLDGT